MPEQRNGNNYDCIVLGAGIAGVTAARELKRRGKKVLLLEATEHVGGRIRSVNNFTRSNDGSKIKKGAPIEEGAHFIHVGPTAPKPKKPFYKRTTYRQYDRFWQEIRKHGFNTDKFSKANMVQIAYPDEWEKPKIAKKAYTSDKDLLKVGGLPLFFPGLFQQIKNFKLNGKDQSAGKFVKTLDYEGKAKNMSVYAISAHTPGILAEKAVELVPPNHPPITPPFKDNISVAGLKLDNIPAQLAEEMHERRMKGPRNENCGYDKLPKAILNEFKKDETGNTKGKFLSQHQVIKVEHSDGGVVVTAKKSGENNKPTVKFSTDSVICTFSYGVLKHRYRSIFGDAFFPKEKQELFDIIQPGPIAKFSIQFKESLWGNGNKLAILSNPTKANVENSSVKHGLRTFFNSFPNQKNGPFILTALLMGADYMAIRDIKDDMAAAKYVFGIIEKIYNPHYKTKPWKMKEKLVYNNGKPNVYRKDWGSDEWTRCGNSYISYNKGKNIKDIKKARETLKSPLNTLPVFWAGEATAPAYNKTYQPLSVHGAYISGIEVAADVIKYLQKSDDFAKYYKKKYKRILA